MNKPTSIRVSHSRSGLNIYMPREASDKIPVSRYSVSVTRHEDTSMTISLHPHEGKNRLSTHADPERPNRLTVRDLRASGLSLKALEEFGVMDVGWLYKTGTISGESVLDIFVPRRTEWPAPRNQKPRTRVGDGQLKLKLSGKAPTESAHQRLGRVLSELNEILGSGSVDDVLFNFRVVQGGATKVWEESFLLRSIKGKIVREETFG